MGPSQATVTMRVTGPRQKVPGHGEGPAGQPKKPELCSLRKGKKGALKALTEGHIMLSSFQLGCARAYGEEHWNQEALIFCPSGTFVAFGLGFLRTVGETALQSDMDMALLTFGASRQTLWPYL